MKIRLFASSLLLISALGLLACEPPNPLDPNVAAPPAATDTDADTPAAIPQETPGASATQEKPSASVPSEKPSAPVQVDYKVLDTPAVGQPVQVELTFHSNLSNASVRASYRIADPSALRFTELPTEKMAVRMQAANGDSRGVYRLRVIPQREGRHYLNVLAEIDTEIGVLTKSVSIPIRVGRNINPQSRPGLPPPQTDIQVDENGEAIISLPAREEK